MGSLWGAAPVSEVLHRIPAVISAFAHFAGALHIMYFPVPLLNGSRFFHPGAAFCNYVNYSKKSRFFRGRPDTWQISALIEITNGRMVKGKRKLRCPNFLAISSLAKFLHSETFESEFAQSRYIAFLLATRGPHEALTALRGFKRDGQADFPPRK